MANKMVRAMMIKLAHKSVFVTRSFLKCLSLIITRSSLDFLIEHELTGAKIGLLST